MPDASASFLSWQFFEFFAFSAVKKAEQAAETLADYLAFIPLVPIPGVLRAVARDPDDDAVLECALAGGATFVITGDLDLLTLGTFQGVQIVRAAEFLRRWETGELQA